MVALVETCAGGCPIFAAGGKMVLLTMVVHDRRPA
jgi:hypothetical protein